MSVRDPIADVVSRIKNASRVGLPTVTVTYSRLKESILKVLAEEGFIGDVQVVGEGARKNIVLQLKYGPQETPVISDIRLVSKLGCRVYVSKRDIKPLKQGAGVALLTTPRGILTDTKAKKIGVGGEVILTVW